MKPVHIKAIISAEIAITIRNDKTSNSFRCIPVPKTYAIKAIPNTITAMERG